jgi:hypothetical protein
MQASTRTLDLLVRVLIFAISPMITLTLTPLFSVRRSPASAGAAGAVEERCREVKKKSRGGGHGRR